MVGERVMITLQARRGMASFRASPSRMSPSSEALRLQSDINQRGVTFGMSPSSKFALAYIALISGHLAERPS